MFLKKLLYKITNPEKYHDYKANLVTERKVKWYKSGIEDKIVDIQKKIENKKELTFLHSGHIGDIVDSLAAIKEISKTHKCKFYIEANKIMNVKYNKHPGGKVILNDKMVSMLLPLLKKQKYIEHVEIYKDQKIDVNLNLFKELAMNLGLGSLRWYFQITGIHANLSEPTLSVETHKEIKNKVVIFRSARINNFYINYKFLSKYNDLLFIGLKYEYELLKREVPNLEFYDCSSFLEMAEIIKASKFFLGNLSLGYSIAEGLKVPRLLEGFSEFPSMYPSGKNAYDFFFQAHFEKWFNYLYRL